MLEQQLINAFMKLAAKVGAGDLIRQLLQQVDENGNPKSWTAMEMERAIHFINHHVENFGKAEAIIVIETLMRKFNVSQHDLGLDHEDLPAVKGLQ